MLFSMLLSMESHLVTQFLTYQINFDATGMHTASGNDNLAAEALRGKAVVAAACGGTRKLSVQADRIGWRGNISDSRHAACHIRHDLIHACYHDYMGGTLNQTSHTVAVAVNIDKFTIQCDGICAH